MAFHFDPPKNVRGSQQIVCSLFFAEKRLSSLGLSQIKYELSPIHLNYPKLIAISTNQLQLPPFADRRFEYEEYEDRQTTAFR